MIKQEDPRDESAKADHRLSASRLWVTLERKFPLLRTMRQALSYIIKRQSLLDGIISSNRVHRLSPLGFFIACYGIFVLILPFVPLANTSTVGWYEPATNLDSPDLSKFFDYLSLNPFVESGQLGAIAATETLYPGRSPASDVVREVVGSDEAEKVAFYLAKRDAQLADNYLHKTKLVKFVNKTIDRGTVGLATVAYFIGSLPLLVLFRRPDRTAKQTLGVAMVVNGFWSIVAVLVVALGRFVTLRFSALSLAYVLCEVFIGIIMIYDFYRVFHYTHQIGVGRALLGYFVTLATTVLVAVLTMIALYPIIQSIAEVVVR